MKYLFDRPRSEQARMIARSVLSQATARSARAMGQQPASIFRNDIKPMQVRRWIETIPATTIRELARFQLERFATFSQPEGMHLEDWSALVALASQDWSALVREVQQLDRRER